MDVSAQTLACSADYGNGQSRKAETVAGWLFTLLLKFVSHSGSQVGGTEMTWAKQREEHCQQEKRNKTLCKEVRLSGQEHHFVEQ